MSPREAVACLAAGSAAAVAGVLWPVVIPFASLVGCVVLLAWAVEERWRGPVPHDHDTTDTPRTEMSRIDTIAQYEKARRLVSPEFAEDLRKRHRDLAAKRQSCTSQRWSGRACARARMPDTENVLVAVSRADAKELLLARGWTVREVNGTPVGATAEGSSQEISPEAALVIVWSREASALRSGGLLDIERVTL